MSVWTPTGIDRFDDEVVFSEEEAALQYQNRQFETDKAVCDNDFNLKFNQLKINANLSTENATENAKSNLKNPFECNNKTKEHPVDDASRRAQETVDMIRACGIEAGCDFYLDSENTLATCGSEKPFVVINNFPVLLSEEFFKLRPRVKKTDTPEPLPDKNVHRR